MRHKLFINSLFYVSTMFKIFNFADGNTLYSPNKELEVVFKNLETDLNPSRPVLFRKP